MKNIKQFKNKKVLVIGGTGFIGTNLIHSIKEYASEISVLSRSGAYLEKKIKQLRGDISDYATVKKSIMDKDIIINLASAKPNSSISNPIHDLQTTCLGALNILEACKLYNKKVKIIFIGSSLEYGSDVELPAREVGNSYYPESFYGIHKTAVSHYVRIYKKLFNINATFLRFSNIYGPEFKEPNKLSIVNLFIRLAHENKKIPIFKSGKQIRDFLFIKDALGAICNAIGSKRAAGEVINIGSGSPVKIVDMANLVVKIVGCGKVTHITWPPDYKLIPFDYVADISKAGNLLGWKPEVSLREGIKLTSGNIKNE